MEYIYKDPECPYYENMRATSVMCEGSSVINFPSIQAASHFVNKNCAGNWQECTIAKMLNKHYEGIYEKPMVTNPKKMGKILRKLRGKRTIEEVAKKVGIDFSTLSRYESGDRVPKDDVKEKLANFYGKEIKDIFF